MKNNGSYLDVNNYKINKSNNPNNYEAKPNGNCKLKVLGGCDGCLFIKICKN